MQDAVQYKKGAGIEPGERQPAPGQVTLVCCVAPVTDVCARYPATHRASLPSANLAP
jgi:hypothetical protein